MSISSSTAEKSTTTASGEDKAKKPDTAARPGKARKAASGSTSGVVRPTLKRTCMSRVCNREGIVWAKVYGHPAWPARVVGADESKVEPAYRAADAHKRAGEDTLVSFFGTSEIAWVARAKAIRPWKAGLQKRFQKKGWRDKTFRKALIEARKYVTDRAGKASITHSD